MEQSNMAMITVNVDRKLYEEFRHRLIDSGLSISDAIREMIFSFCQKVSNDRNNKESEK